VFGLNYPFGVRAPYEQHASDSGGGAGDPDAGYEPDSDPSDPGTGSPSDGDPAGSDPGTSQYPPAGLTDEQRRDLDEYNRIRQAFDGRLPTREEVDRLRQVARAALGETPDGQPADPRLARVRDGLLKAFPELADILELAKRRDDIYGLLERAPDLEAVTSAQWQRLAETTRENLVSQFATTMLGAGKTAADVSLAQAKELVMDFAAWMKAVPERVRRYETGDSRLVGEYLNRARSLWAPVQREHVAGTVARRPSAPAEGPSGGAPSGNRPAGDGAPQSNDDRLDGAIDRAFQYVTDAQR